MINLEHHEGEIIGNFKLISLIGKGGFGEVWKAEHVELPDKYEVFKFPNKEEFVNILKEEGKILHKISHESIVKITDMKTSGENPYIRMEYVEWETLEDLIIREIKISSERALKIIFEISKILSIIHSKDIVHGDLKPSNIFIKGEMVKIADFGLAKIKQDEFKQYSLSGSLSPSTEKSPGGSWEYMSYEQKNGSIDKNNDIYSLGVILYRMITGRIPSGLEAPSYFTPECSKDIDEFVIKMLRPHEGRFQKIEEVLNYFNQINVEQVNAEERFIENDKSKNNEEFEKEESISAKSLSFIFFALGIILLDIAFISIISIKNPFLLFFAVILSFLFFELARNSMAHFWPYFCFWVAATFSLISVLRRINFFLYIFLFATILSSLWFLVKADKFKS